MPDWKASEADDIYTLLVDAAKVLKVKNTLTESTGRNYIARGPALRLLGIPAQANSGNLYEMYGPDPKKFGPALVNHVADGFHPEGEQGVLRAALSKVVEDELAKSGSAVEKTTQQNIEDCDTLIQFAKANPGPTWDVNGKIGSKDGQSFFNIKLKEYPSIAKVRIKIDFNKKGVPPPHLRKKKEEGEEEEIFGWAGGFIRWIEGKKAELKKQLEGSGKAKADKAARKKQMLEIFKAVHKAVEDHERPKIRKAFQDDDARGAFEMLKALGTGDKGAVHKRLYPRAEARAKYNKEQHERAGALAAANEKWKKGLFKAWRAYNMGWLDIGKYLKSRYAPKNNYPDYEDARFENGNYEGGDLLQEFVGI